MENDSPRVDSGLMACRASAVVVVATLLLGCGSRSGLFSDEPAETRGELPPSALPVPEDRAVDLSAGLFHSCAVGASGAARCWGFNTAGQLGDGGAASRAAAALVVALPPAVRVAAGREHTCALDDGGSAWCWGTNANGELGGDMEALRSLEPVSVRGLSPANALSAGGHHTCALHRGGSITCWGRNDHGQLAGRAGDDRILESPPIALAARVSAGWLHTCAVLRTGEVACWGHDGDGRLGVRGGTSLVARVPGVLDAADVSAGDHHSCAVDLYGAAWCWGRNDWAQAGQPASDAEPPGRVPGLADAVEISAGHEHTCALRATGAVVCWGRADRGQLGDGGGYALSEVPITTLTEEHGVEQISVGWRHGCARLGTGAIFCWGRTTEGQVGGGTRGLGVEPSPVLGWDG